MISCPQKKEYLLVTTFFCLFNFIVEISLLKRRITNEEAYYLFIIERCGTKIYNYTQHMRSFIERTQTSVIKRAEAGLELLHGVDINLPVVVCVVAAGKRGDDGDIVTPAR
jgi:hypothetical protein